jgi:PAS domain S-box-containing protein
VTENTAFLKRLLDKTGEGLAVVQDGRIYFANATFTGMLRFAGDESPVGMPLSSLVHPRDRAALSVWLSSGKGGTAGEHRNLTLLRRDQTALDTEIAIFPYDNDVPGTWLITLRDVSARRATERALDESKQKQAAMLAAIPDLVISLSGDGTILGYSAGRYYQPHFKEEDLVGQRLQDMFPQRVAEPALVHIRRALATGEPQFFEYWLRNEDDGSVHHFEVRVLKSQEFEAIAIARDISDRKHAEEALADSEARYRSLVELSPDAILVVSDTIEFANSGAMRLFGATRRSELVGKPISRFLDPVYRDLAQQRMSGLRDKGGSVPFVEERWRRIDDTAFFVEVAGRALSYRGKRAILMVMRDVTERKRNLEALRESEEKFRNLVEGSRQGVCIHRDFKPLFANQAFTDIFGFDFPDDVLALESLLTVFLLEDRAEIASNLTNRERGEPMANIFRRKALRRDGVRIWIENQLSVVEWEGAPAIQLTVLDITDRVSAETMKNDFISTVSHELRTPLTSISGALSLMAGGMIGELPDAAKGLIDIASRNSERLVRLVNDILDIERIESGRLDIEFRPLRVKDVLDGAVSENRPYADKFGIDIQVIGEAPNARINGGPDQLHQVLTNLISNAIKHSPLHGVIEIGAQQQGGGITFSITDHGPGIPPEFRGKVFDKFTQADASGASHGSGLGLSICKLLIEKHGGHIGFDSRPGNTTFHFTLPDLDPPAVPRLVVG